MMNISLIGMRALWVLMAMPVLHGVAHAAVIAVNSRIAITETDFIDWAAIKTALGGTSTPASGTSSVTNGAVTFTFSEADNNTLNLFSFGGLPGTDLGTHNVSGSPITLSFLQGFQMIGFDLQSNICCNAAYTVNLDVYNGITLLQSFSGSTFSSPNANPIFVGAASGSANITKVVISTSAGNQIQFALDRVSLNSGSVSSIPEPGTFSLILLGGVGAFALRRKR